MNIDAGAALNTQNPAQAPAEHAHRLATRNCPLHPAATAKMQNAMTAIPAASPSMLSKKFVALKINTSQNTVTAHEKNSFGTKSEIRRPPSRTAASAIRN